MDIISLHNLKINTIIGTLAWERQNQQCLSFDLDIGTDIREAAKSDDLQKTIDYADLGTRLRTFVEETHYQLLETLAESAANFLLQEFSLKWLRLKVSKPAVLPQLTAVSISIERELL